MIFLLCFVFRLHFSQSNPKCRAKRYLCAEQPLQTDVCVFVKDVQEKYNFIQPCDSLEKPFCPYQKAKFGKDALCEPVINDEKMLPGDPCDEDTDCFSKVCKLGKCSGLNKAENCQTNTDCNPGLFCSANNQCDNQKEFDQPCRDTYECLNNCACNNNKCSFYYSIENGIASNNSETCKSGFIQDNVCEEAPISKFKGQPCSDDEECVYLNLQNEVVMRKKCECGFNGGAFSYCPLAQGDSEFLEMKKSLQFIISNNINCHTQRRFGPCDYIQAEEIQEYLLKKEKYESFPKLVMNDICIARTINWSYWRYFLGLSVLKGSFLYLIIFLLLN